MKRFLPFLLLLQLAACKKEETPAEQQKDYSAFLAQAGTTFSAKLDGARISWTFGFAESQSVMGYQNGNGICDPDDPIRLVFFGLTSESDLTTRFMINSPKYDSGSEANFDSIFTLGKKRLGDFGTDFHLTMFRNGKYYQTSSADKSNENEILKTQLVADYLGPKLRVWFRVEGKLSNCSCSESNSILSDGLMIAEFRGVRYGD